MKVKFGCNLVGLFFGEAKFTEGINGVGNVDSAGNSNEDSDQECLFRFGVWAEFQLNEVNVCVSGGDVLWVVGGVSAFKG
eukprot:1152078-Pelagomonas_calceolata.AAC.7